MHAKIIAFIASLTTVWAGVRRTSTQAATPIYAPVRITPGHAPNRGISSGASAGAEAYPQPHPAAKSHGIVITPDSALARCKGLSPP